MGSLSYAFFLHPEISSIQLHYELVPSILILFGTYLIASVFFGVYSMAVDTLFLCFCKYSFVLFLNQECTILNLFFTVEDCERNEGNSDKPFYMSKQLMKILHK